MPVSSLEIVVMVAVFRAEGESKLGNHLHKQSPYVAGASGGRSVSYTNAIVHFPDFYVDVVKIV